jgi:hypothetical protein
MGLGQFSTSENAICQCLPSFQFNPDAYVPCRPIPVASCLTLFVLAMFLRRTTD